MTASGNLRLRCALLLCAILALTAVVYLPGLGGGFMFDDSSNIVDNKALVLTSVAPRELLRAAMSSPSSELRRPLASLSFAFDIYHAGLDPRQMKRTNLLIHLANVLLVFLLAFQIWRLQASLAAATPSNRAAMWFAAVCAAAWALAPINLTPVLYVVQRMESLCNLFVLAGLSAYVAGRQRQLDGRSGWWLITAGLFFGTGLGLLAKESALLLPLYVLVLEWALLRWQAGNARDGKRLRWLCIAIAAGGCLGAGLLCWSTLGADIWAARTFTALQRELTEPRVLWSYAQWTLFPSLSHLGFYYDNYPVSTGFLQPLSTALSIVGIVLALVGAALLRKAVPVAALGILWFFASQSLTAAPIPLELVFEHRNYFPSFGLFLAVAALGAWVAARVGRHMAMGALAVLWIGFFAMTTGLRAMEWSNPIRLIESLAAKQPDSPRTQYELGRMYLIMSRYDPNSRFTPMARETLVRAAAVPGASALAEQALLLQSAYLGSPPQPAWWDGLMHKLALHRPGPQEIASLYSLSHCVIEGHCHYPPGRITAAYQAALAYRPPSLDLEGSYADYAVNVLHDDPLAIRLMRDAVARAPHDPVYRENLIFLLLHAGDAGGAAHEFAALRGQIGDADAFEWAKASAPSLVAGMR